jgi:hypothetical protein
MTIKILSAFLVLAFFSNCSVVTVTTSKKNPTKDKLDRVLIIAMTNVYSTRSMYEEQMYHLLRDKGYDVYTSVNIDRNKKDLYTKEEILEIVKNKNVAGVITVSLQDVNSKDTYSTSAGVYTEYINSPNYFFNFYDTYFGFGGWSYNTKRTIDIVGNLFDAKDKSLVYVVDAKIKNASDAEENAKEFCQSLANAFAESGYLKKIETTKK